MDYGAKAVHFDGPSLKGRFRALICSSKPIAGFEGYAKTYGLPRSGLVQCMLSEVAEKPCREDSRKLGQLIPTILRAAG